MTLIIDFIIFSNLYLLNSTAFPGLLTAYNSIVCERRQPLTTHYTRAAQVAYLCEAVACSIISWAMFSARYLSRLLSKSMFIVSCLGNLCINWVTCKESIAIRGDNYGVYSLVIYTGSLMSLSKCVNHCCAFRYNKKLKLYKSWS